jgi:hypothetical protein
VGAKVIAACGFLGWGAQFLGARVNPVPPPQVQLEEVNGQTTTKKDAESGDPKEQLGIVKRREDAADNQTRVAGPAKWSANSI